MCYEARQEDEAHTKVFRKYHQDVGLLLAVQPLAAFDKAVHRFRTKRMRKEVFYILKEGATSQTR